MKNRAITLALLICMATFICAAPARAQQKPLIDLVATPAFAGNYALGTWLPITLGITNNGPPVVARISAALTGSKESYVQERQLAGGEAQRITIYVPMFQDSHEVLLTIVSGSTTLAEQTVAVRPRSDERILGIMGSDELRLSLPRREDLASMPFTSVRVAPTDLPDRAAGLGSLGLLLINAVPSDNLSPDQINALLGWVYAGGHLLVGGGPGASLVNDWLPAELRAASIGAEQQMSDAPLADLAGTAGPGPLPAVTLAPLPGGILTGPSQGPAWVARPFGTGQITQLAFDPGLPALRSWVGAPGFWDKLLQPANLISTPFGNQTSVDSLQEQFLAGALTALPTVSQPPVDLFFLMLIIYTLVIGPLLALGLRRIDRQAWSWLLIPTLALGSGVLLLTAAVNLRADSRVITQVSLVEFLGEGQARARTFVGVLSPQTQTLTASQPAGAIVRPVLSTNGLYGAISGISGPIPQEGDRLPVSVDAWAMQGLVAERQIALPGIVSTITINNQGTVVKMQNATSQRLLDVVAVYGEQLVRLGDIRPGEEASGRWAPNLRFAAPGTALSTMIFNDEIEQARLPGRANERRVQARAAMINAAVIRGTAETDAGPLVLAWMDTSPLDVAVDASSAARQSLTLLVIHPHVQGSGPVMLPQDWLRADPVISQRTTCFSEAGAGIAASPAPATIALRLPGDLSPLRASDLTLNLDSAKTWPNAGVTTELYNWTKGAWVAQPFDGPGDLKVPSPADYLSQGMLRLRLSGAIERAGCLYIRTKLQGSMP